MTRFSAFANDSDEDGSSSDESYDARGIPSGAGPSTKRAIAPIEQDVEPEDDDEYSEDGEKEGGDEEDDSELEDDAMDNVRLADPSLIPRARQLGIDRQKMLVMQTSLFHAPEEAAVIQDISRPEPSRKALLPPATIGRKHSRDSDGEGLRADSRQVRGVTRKPTFPYHYIAAVLRS